MIICSNRFMRHPSHGFTFLQAPFDQSPIKSRQVLASPEVKYATQHTKNDTPKE